MLTSTPRLAILFACAIVLPTVVLAYLGIAATQDDTQRLLSEQRRLGALFRMRFDQELDRSLEALRGALDVEDGVGEALDDLPDGLLRHVFVLDRQRRWVVPDLRPEQTVWLSPDFRDAVSAAHQVEFAARDIGRAQSLYQDLVTRSTEGAERAIALNAAARCARKMGNDEGAERAYSEIIEAHPRALDENGNHLATYAHLQMAGLLLRGGRSGEAVGTLAHWVRALGRGAYPIHEGATHHLESAEELILPIVSREGDGEIPLGVSAAARDLRSHLRKTGALLRFIQRHASTIRQPDLTDSAQMAGAKPGRVLFRAGHSDGEPYLIAIVSGPRDLMIGADLDLSAIQTELVRSVLGQSPGQSGFHLSLLDDPAAARFQRAHDNDMATVVALSDRGIGLRLGLYADDSAGILRDYRGRRWLLLAAIAMLSVTIGFGGYLLARDATRERRLSHLRSQFVSNVSHEFKTPLASIRLFAETLLMGRFQGEAEQTDCLETILHEGERLSRLVDNVLEFSRIEKGRKTYSLQEEDLADIGRSCLDLFRYRFREEGFRTRIEIPDSMPPLLLDRDAATQAILNLLSNAAKYSADDKEVKVRIADAGDRAVVEVTDRGIGIPMHEHSRIFDAFYRADSHQLKASGAGLGLTVVKHVMDAHGGRVEVESTPDQGSSFRLVFPRRPEA